ncbi:helix-turn-helix domain-containing protein [Morganella morganii]|nr:helix-turn-helix domain-containing protein [Morganella morganii]EMD0828610.1 helix-turn-helix domain-containing protein [Morganella morganii]
MSCNNVVRNSIKFTLLLMPGFSLLSLGGFLDKLRFSGDSEDYGRQISCVWNIVSLDNLPVKASCGAVILNDTPLNEAAITPDFCDYFVIFGGNNPSIVMRSTSRYLPLLRRLNLNAIKLVSIDNAAFLLADSGMVRDCILVHWRHFSEFQNTFPWLKPSTDKNVMENGRIYSCPGGNSTIELAAYLIEKRLGREKAFKGLSDMLVAGFSPPSCTNWSNPDLDKLTTPVRNAIKFMRQNISAHLAAEKIAVHCGLSRRHLDRTMVSETGLTVRQTFSVIKLDYACWLLLKTSKKLAEIANETGFTDLSHFSRQFRKRTGLTPEKWRQENRLSKNDKHIC